MMVCYGYFVLSEVVMRLSEISQPYLSLMSSKDMSFLKVLLLVCVCAQYQKYHDIAVFGESEFFLHI